MVVLSAAIVTRPGKVLVARQFVTMSKLRIEGLLSAFPKLVGIGGEHTFIETENVRYLYQPIEQLYVLIITNKQSNIMEDLETLRLVAKLVPEYCHGNDAAGVTAAAFQLLFALDEVISIGYKENITIQQVRTFTEMDSHEAKLQKIIKASKEDDARKKMKERAQDIDKRKIELSRLQSANVGSSGVTGYQMSQSNQAIDSPGHQDFQAIARPAREAVRPVASRAERAQKGAVGLQLGLSIGGGPSAQSGDDFFNQLASEEHLNPVPARVIPAAISRTSAAAQPQQSFITQGICVSIEEVLTIECERDGQLRRVESSGTIRLAIGDPELSKISVAVDTSMAPEGTRFQPHPKMDRDEWKQSSTLCLKEKDKGFPVGSSTAAPILKWRFQSTDDTYLPISVSIWPSHEDNKTIVNVVYESYCSNMLENCIICIPCTQPQVGQCNGTHSFDGSTLYWSLGSIEAGSSGTMEFTSPHDPDSFFPVQVQFTSPSVISDVRISAIYTASNVPVDFETRGATTVQSFTLD